MKIYNFSPGPACLPRPVVEAAKKALTNYKNTGISLIELSHRSGPIMQLFDAASNRLRRLMKIPENYEILWLQGGASLQFTMVPQNLLPDDSCADFIETGLWSTKAITEGVVLFPSALGITTGSLPSITETQEFVVPKSIPIILLIILIFKFNKQMSIIVPFVFYVNFVSF